MNASECSSESEAETAASIEAEVDEAIAVCGGDARAALRATLIANAYLEAEVERLSEAISTLRPRAALQAIHKISQVSSTILDADLRPRRRRGFLGKTVPTHHRVSCGP